MPQRAATSARAARRRRLRPPGSSRGRAPASTAPRSPARRGTQATRAPVARARASRAVKAPGTSASRSPASMTAPGRRRASIAGPPQRTVGQRAQGLRLGARQRGEHGRLQLLRRARGERGEVEDGQRPRADALREPQEDDRRLLLRLEAGEQHGGGGLEVLVGDGAATGTGPATVRREERQLLAGVCARAGVDVVGAERHAGELRVGVGVLDGQPAAGQHADAALVTGGEPGRRRRRPSASVHDAGLQLAVVVAHQRRASAGRPAWRRGRPSGPCRSSTPR